MLTFTLLCLFGLTYSQVVSADQGTEAIVGGDIVGKGDFKYSVSIHFGEDSCGGAIIADQYILTAAHCFTDFNGHFIKQPCQVIAGTHDITHEHGAIVIPAESLFYHKHFVRRTHLHDIAILKLKHKLNLASHSKKIAKINLPHSGANYDNVCAVVSGFGDHAISVHDNNGILEEIGENDGKLRFANVRIISNMQCARSLKGRIIHPNFICGHVDQRNRRHHHYEGVCSGDSGSPLVYGGEIIGVVNSSPLACNETSEPAAYQRVSAYVNMIHNVLNGNPDPDVQYAIFPH